VLGRCLLFSSLTAISDVVFLQNIQHDTGGNQSIPQPVTRGARSARTRPTPATSSVAASSQLVTRRLRSSRTRLTRTTSSAAAANSSSRPTSRSGHSAVLSSTATLSPAPSDVLSKSLTATTSGRSGCRTRSMSQPGASKRKTESSS